MVALTMLSEVVGCSGDRGGKRACREAWNLNLIGVGE